MQLLSFSHPVLLSSLGTSHQAGQLYISSSHSINTPIRHDYFNVQITHHSARDTLKEWVTTTSARWPYSSYTSGEPSPHLPYPLLWEVHFSYVDPTYTPGTDPASGSSAANTQTTNPQTYIHIHKLPGAADYHTQEFTMPRTYHINGVPHYLQSVHTQAELTSSQAQQDFDYKQHGECVTVALYEDSK